MPSPVLRPKREMASRSRTSPPPRSCSPAGRVLLADPCADTVESMAWLLRLWGYAVDTAASGPEIFEAALAGRPDVILMELALPTLDGLQVARWLRQAVGERPPLLVAVSGYGSEKDRARSREAGFDCHFVKPVCPEVVRAWLSAKCVSTREDDR